MSKVALPGEGKERQVPLSVVVAIAAVLSGGTTYGVNWATAGGVTKDEARTIAREEIKAANVPDKADVAVISEKVAQLEKSSQSQDKKLDLITNLLLEMKRQ